MTIVGLRPGDEYVNQVGNRSFMQRNVYLMIYQELNHQHLEWFTV